MKLLTAFVFAAGLCLGVTILAEEAVQPNKTPEAKPSEEAPKKDPFSPSALMRMRAQKPAAEVVATPSGVGTVVHSLPVLEGVLVKNNSVLASFRLGNKSIVIEPRSTFVMDGVNYTFIGYANEIATLRDEEGRIHDLRIVQPASNGPQRVPEPSSNDK